MENTLQLVMYAHMTHGGLLAHGKFEDYEVECPWHQSEFDVKTGELKHGRCLRDRD
jgi:nitrite reductase/ring-hydroxylating ferredoxin subunit